MPSTNITETLSITHQAIAAAPSVGSTPKSVMIPAGSKINQTGSRVASGIGQATVTASAIDISALGGGVLGRFAIHNLDGTNNLILLTQVTTGIATQQLLPGEQAQGRYGTGVTAPAVQASASTVLYEYLICEA